MYAALACDALARQHEEQGPEIVGMSGPEARRKGSSMTESYAGLTRHTDDSRTAVVEAERRRERDAINRALLTPTPPEKAAAIAAILRRNGSVGTDQQNARALTILRDVGETTAMELQELADIRHPPARILQLKQQGHTIVGRWVRQVSALGRTHRTMAYSLARERA